MMNDISSKTYAVAEHRFSLAMSAQDRLWSLFGSYEPFETNDGDEVPVFRISVFEKEDDRRFADPQRIGIFEDGAGNDITVFKTEEQELVFDLNYLHSGLKCRLYVSEDYSSAAVCLTGPARARSYALNSCLMMMFAFSTANLGTVVLHASVIRNSNAGYLFLGKSGTGKSTHSRLWIDYVDRSELLNDDNPVVRIIDGRAVVYGSPWSGKTPCYRNEKAPVGAVVRIRQSPLNKITKMNTIQAYAAILPSCTNMRWEKRIADGVHQTICRLIGLAPVYIMDCRPDQEAAMICSETVTNHAENGNRE